MQERTFNRGLLVIISILFIATIARGFYTIYIEKNFNYLVEASCDPQSEKCFMRDCSVADECPPNNFSHYKNYLIQAKDFPECTDNTCKNLCAGDTTRCTPVPCDEKNGDTCVGQE